MHLKVKPDIYMIVNILKNWHSFGIFRARIQLPVDYSNLKKNHG